MPQPLEGCSENHADISAACNVGSIAELLCDKAWLLSCILWYAAVHQTVVAVAGAMMMRAPIRSDENATDKSNT